MAHECQKCGKFSTLYGSENCYCRPCRYYVPYRGETESDAQTIHVVAIDGECVARAAIEEIFHSDPSDYDLEIMVSTGGGFEKYRAWTEPSVEFCTDRIED